MIRKARKNDIEQVSQIYDLIHKEEDAGKCIIGWETGVYPVKSTAHAALERDDLFVMEDGKNGEIVAAAIINKIQVPEYEIANWEHKDIPEAQVMVLHTLVVSPIHGRNGYGKNFVEFYEKYAKELGCNYLRIDTNEKNQRARRMYKSLGYSEADIVPCVFNGIEGVRLVCLEKKLEK